MPVQLNDVLASARVVSLPLRTRFRGVTDREVMLFEGPNGWSEWSPFLEYQDAESSVWLAAALDFAFAEQPPLLRDRVAVNATLPAVTADQIEKTLKRFGSFRTLKIKVAEPGQTIKDDLDRLWAALDLYPEARIRLDANGGWSVAQALQVAAALDERGVALDFLEQPVQTLAEMIELKGELANRGLSVLIAADELVRKSTDPLAVAHAGGADVLILKAQPLGGVSKALELAAQANLPVAVSSALESSVGLAMGLALAATLPEQSFESGLGTAALLAGDVTREPLLPADGWLEVRRPAVAPMQLDIFRAEDHRTDWWIERFERCLRLLDL